MIQYSTVQYINGHAHHHHHFHCAVRMQETPLIFTCPTHHAMVATEHAKIVSAAAKRGKEAPSTPAPAKSHDALARRTIDRSEEKRATPGRKGRKKFVTAGGGAGRRTSGASNPAAAVAMVVGKGVRSIPNSGRGITLSGGRGGADSEAANLAVKAGDQLRPVRHESEV